MLAIRIIAACGAALGCACAGAGEVRVLTVTDAADPLPGLALVATGRAGALRGDASPAGVEQMPGWPQLIGAHPNFKPLRGAVLADIVGDGDLEIIVGGTDGRVYAWDLHGDPLPGFPVSVIGYAQYAPSVGDLDGDGHVEIVQSTRGFSSGGRLYAIDHRGRVLSGFPISFDNRNLLGSPTLCDLDDDGQLEIIVGVNAGSIGYLHIVEPDGSQWGGRWPLELDHVPAATAGAGDLDGDGAPEILYQSYNSLYVLRPDGTSLPGWPKQIPNANFSYQSPALADLDGDGDLEIVVGAHRNASGCYVFHHDAAPMEGWPKLLGTWTYCPPTVTDLEGDGVLEILDGRAGYVSGNSECFWAWDRSGNLKSGFPYVSDHGGGSEGPLTVADIDGDGRVEIFADHNYTIGGNGYLFGVDARGRDLPGFPLRPLGFTYMNGATIGDVDRDGDYELAVLSSHDAGVDVNLYTLTTRYASTARDWKVYHARNRRGGLYPAGAQPCAEDLNGDGRVDQADLATLLADWGCTGGGCQGDVDGDGDTDQADLAALLAAYGQAC